MIDDFLMAVCRRIEGCYRWWRGYCRPHCDPRNHDVIDNYRGRTLFRCTKCGDSFIW